MALHNVEDIATVYLSLEDGVWVIDPVGDDGDPLVGLDGGPQCVNGEDGATDHVRSCEAINDSLPLLPTLPQLYDMLRVYYGGKP